VRLTRRERCLTGRRHFRGTESGADDAN